MYWHTQQLLAFFELRLADIYYPIGTSSGARSYYAGGGRG